MFIKKPCVKPELLSPLVLAYIGDAVYELYIRNSLVSNLGGLHVNLLHRKATDYVKATTQSQLVLALKEFLTQEELELIRKGRNAKATRSSKNARMIDYRYSTGFEALIGYLYLKGEFTRLEEILERIYMTVEKGKVRRLN